MRNGTATVMPRPGCRHPGHRTGLLSHWARLSPPVDPDPAARSGRRVSIGHGCPVESGDNAATGANTMLRSVLGEFPQKPADLPEMVQ